MLYLRSRFASCICKYIPLCFFTVTIFSSFLPIYLAMKILIIKSLSYDEFIELITFLIITTNCLTNYIDKIKA